MLVHRSRNVGFFGAGAGKIDRLRIPDYLKSNCSRKEEGITLVDI